ncbi:MAG TPA: ADP-forming succinate--CoA ligase subunit beta [Gammaproteobacteria bacterium]|nr:ADP-forming succinate--CoA ligase subunit beta [Gammaproteobacteria bacterium]
MNLHEYQAKELFASYGLPVANNVVIRSVHEIPYALEVLGTSHVVVKAQVHAGGRGKAGGVRLVKDRDSLTEAARDLLHKRLVTHQTTQKGQPINELLIEAVTEIDSEMYLGMLVDRLAQTITVMISKEGGVDIEKVAAETPEKILKFHIHPQLGVMPYQVRDMGFHLGLSMQQIKQLTTIVQGLGKMFTEKDLSMVEINPLVITQSSDLLCLDAKVNVDENALYRQTDLRDLRDSTQEDEREIQAREWELNYIALDGNIGCMVNGAGLAMATMDIIKLHGGNPANFLDVGGGATRERVAEAFKIILSDQNVKAVLVNIFGGIVRCDLIAEGIIGAVQEVGIQVPVVVRLEGNRAVEASKILEKSGLNITPVQDLTQAAVEVVKLAGAKA